MAASRSPGSATAFAIGRPMITTVRKASAAALVCRATAAQAAEGELWFRKPEKVALARGIQKDGFPCPEIKAVYFIGAKSDGNHMRAVCGTADEAVPSSSFRLTVRGSYRVEPWDGEASVVRTLFASAFVLRASLD